MDLQLLGRPEEDLFGLIGKSAQIAVRGGNLLVNYSIDSLNRELKLAKVTASGHEAEQNLKVLVKTINTRYILPFDREDIFKLGEKPSNSLNNINGIFESLTLYKDQIDDRIRVMVKILYKTLLLQKKALRLINRVELNRREILKCCEKIRKLKKTQDNLYINGFARLLHNKEDPVRIIKLQDLYKGILRAQDQLLDTAGFISYLVIKYS